MKRTYLYKPNKPFIKRLVKQIFELAIDITTETKSDVFVEYAGHIDALEVAIHENGWDKEKDPTEKFIFYLDEDNKKVRKKLMRIKDILQKLKKGGN